jgi:hypothetical protein
MIIKRIPYSIILKDIVDSVCVYLRTMDYTLGPLAGRQMAITMSMASHVVAFAAYMASDHNKWARDVADRPIMYEVFVDPGRPEFFDCSLGTHLPITHSLTHSLTHSPFAPSFFHEFMTVLDVLAIYGINPDEHLRSGAVLILGITVLDLRYPYPGLRSALKLGHRPGRRTSTSLIVLATIFSP